MQLTALHVYPVKSCRGIAVSEAATTTRGLAGDRRWMVVDDEGRFITQREHAAMTQVLTALDGETLVLSHAEAGELRLPMAVDAGERREVQVWSSRVSAVVHEDGGRWMSRALGRSCMLVHMPDDVARAVDPARGRPGEVVSFADGYPFLLASEASLANLNQRMGAPLPMARFRPNLVVDGGAPFAEDQWRVLRVGDVIFRNVKPCERCVVTTIDQESGGGGVEPLRTLAKYRAWDGAVWFGVNLIGEAIGRLRVGDRVEVVEG